jgi:hypothetical protein
MAFHESRKKRSPSSPRSANARTLESGTISSADFGATKIDITLPCQTADDGFTPRHNSTGISSGIGRTA